MHAAAFFFMIAARGNSKETAMWHLIAIPGIGAALGFRIVDAMSLEANGKFAREPQRAATRTEGRSS
ncbi:hypothetical protein [Paraburkholderia dilworthii]|uniref:hypothetical protein n=1 Tax=Paraburkholderia dilworthii TaxID=948106 RepID=UPI0004864A2A